MRTALAICAAMMLAAPTLAAAQDRDAQCALLSRTGDHFARTALPGFDPATSPAPLSVPRPEGSTALVLCRRGTLLPELTDWRVPAEAHVPLAITDERRVVQIDLVDGHLQASFRRGQATPDEDAALKARIDQLQAAMEGQGAAK